MDKRGQLRRGIPGGLAINPASRTAIASGRGGPYNPAMSAVLVRWAILLLTLAAGVLDYMAGTDRIANPERWMLYIAAYWMVLGFLYLFSGSILGTVMLSIVPFLLVGAALPKIMAGTKLAAFFASFPFIELLVPGSGGRIIVILLVLVSLWFSAGLGGWGSYLSPYRSRTYGQMGWMAGSRFSRFLYRGWRRFNGLGILAVLLVVAAIFSLETRSSLLGYQVNAAALIVNIMFLALGLLYIFLVKSESRTYGALAKAVGGICILLSLFGFYSYFGGRFLMNLGIYNFLSLLVISSIAWLRYLLITLVIFYSFFKIKIWRPGLA